MSDRPDKPIVFPARSSEEPPTCSIAERRSGGRFPIAAAVEVYDVSSKTRMTGRCSDLSGGGCYVDTLTPFAVGSAVRVRIEHENREFEAAAVVTFVNVPMGMGLAFTEIKPEHQDVLRFWIANLSGEQSPQSSAFTPKPGTDTAGADANTRLVLNELITLLVRKNILTENEGAQLLLQMFR